MPMSSRLFVLSHAVAAWLRRACRGRPRLTAAVTLILAAGAWGASLAGAWFFADVALGLPGREAIRGVGDMAVATTLYDISNRPVFTIFKEQRIEVPLARVSPHLVQAVLAIEDQRFYQHRGIDVVRIAAAALANLRSGRRAQGGSTITQQLARQSFLTPDKTFRRKLKEVLLSARLEQAFTKDQILELYLNKVYLGEGFYGVEAASLGYFDKHASDLTLEEAALIAGLIQSPSAYAPGVNKARALARRNVVLAAMRETGAIDEATYERARRADVVLANGLQREEPFGLYFKELVRRELVEQFGWERVSQGGLRVYTTIDARLQQQVEREVEQHLAAIESRRGYPHAPRGRAAASGGAPDYLQAAVVVLEPRTGEIRALVGGRDFAESPFNRAVQARRQAGSAFKPFVYAAAIEQGLTPATLLTGLDDPVLTAEGAWMPEDEHSGVESMTLRTALRTSSNRAAVRLLQTLGIGPAVRAIRAFHVGDVPAVPSLALGAGEVTLQQMTAAFAAFANGGLVRRPIAIRRVEDRDGRVLFSAENPPERAVSEVTAFLVANMLADVIAGGTGWRARASGFLLPAAGKTGTTNDYKDVWFVGFTPRVAAGVWIGFDQPKPIIANGYAGDLAVPLWAAIMKHATAGHPPEWLPRPAGVEAVSVCRLSGQLPAPGCESVEVVRDDGQVDVRSMVYTEYFARGTAPVTACPLHASPSWLERVAGLFGARPGPPPIPLAESGLPPIPAPPPAPVAAAPAAAQPDQVAEAPKPEKKKRGFWSRLFGRRDRDEEGEDKTAEGEQTTKKPVPRPHPAPPPRKPGT